MTPTPLRISVAASVAALVLLFVIFELIRSRRLQERYALLWLLTGVVTLVLAAWRDGLGRLSETLGVSYPPSMLFLATGFFVLVLLLHYSTVISRLSDQNRILAQRLALLEGRIDEGSADRDAEG
jgi:hypothetical protein